MYKQWKTQPMIFNNENLVVHICFFKYSGFFVLVIFFKQIFLSSENILFYYHIAVEVKIPLNNYRSFYIGENWASCKLSYFLSFSDNYVFFNHKFSKLNVSNMCTFLPCLIPVQKSDSKFHDPKLPTIICNWWYLLKCVAGN